MCKTPLAISPRVIFAGADLTYGQWCQSRPLVTPVGTLDRWEFPQRQRLPSGVRKKKTSDSDEESNRSHTGFPFSVIVVLFLNTELSYKMVKSNLCVLKHQHSAVLLRNIRRREDMRWGEERKNGRKGKCRGGKVTLPALKKVLFSMWSHWISPCDEYLIRPFSIYILKSN